MRAYIPYSLDGRVDDGMAYILSSINWLTACKKFKRRGYVPLRLDYLRAILGRNGAGRYLTYVIGDMMVKRDDGYLSGKVSLGYRICRPYCGELVVPHRYRDAKIVANISNITSRRIDAMIGDRPHLRWMFGNLLRLDFRGGLKAVLAGQGTIMKQNARIHAVGRIEDRDWWFAEDPKTGRVFHNVTTLPRDCRALLLIDGQPIAETDIANCQPFLLGAEYPEACAERARFMDLCLAGRFYEELNRLLPEPFADRELLKANIYQSVLYGTKWSTSQPFFRAFTTAFPVLGRRLEWSKRVEGHQALPLRMQRAEASLMIGQVLPRVMREMPECGATTIHDSLALPRRHAEQARAIIAEEITRRHGVCPPIKIK